MNNIKTSSYVSGIKKYKDQLEARIAFLEKKQPAAFDEHLKYKLQNNKLFYYTRKPGNNNHPVYVKLSDKEEIERLIKLWYIQKVLPKLKSNLRAANKFLKLHSGYEEGDIVNSFPAPLQEKNVTFYKSNRLIIKEWLSKEYIRNPYKPDGLIHETARGDKVRSKSEVMIADILFAHSIPYKLECPLILSESGKTIYPDFTIIHPVTLKEIIWEHFGMMDDPEYSREALKKINDLARDRYLMGDNLIYTFERSDMPLTRSTIELYVENFF